MTIPHHVQTTHTFHEWVPSHVCATYLVHRNDNNIVVETRINGTTNNFPSKTGTFLHVNVRGHSPPCVFPKWTRSRDLCVAFVNGGPGPLGTKIVWCRYFDRGRGALGLLHGNCCFYVRDTTFALCEMEDGIPSTCNLEGHTCCATMVLGQIPSRVLLLTCQSFDV